MCLSNQGAPRSLEPALFLRMYQEYTPRAIPSKENSEIETQRASPDWRTKLPGGRSKDGDRDTVSGDRILEHTVSVPGDFSFSEDPGLPQVLSSILKAEFRFLHFLIDSCYGYTKSNRFGYEGVSERVSNNV